MSSKIGAFYTKEMVAYDFGNNYPFSSYYRYQSMRAVDKYAFGDRLQSNIGTKGSELLTLFHTEEYIAYVQKASDTGEHVYLDRGDTPAFKGCYEAAVKVVDYTISAIDAVMSRTYEISFVPLGDLHHAMPSSASGFCIFNDAAIGIRYLLERNAAVAYVDIDAHHGDGVYYPFEEEDMLYIVDIHGDGRFLFPGTGKSDETGRGKARGTKFNLPLMPGSGSKDLLYAFDNLFYDLLEGIDYSVLILQMGVDGHKGDPLTHLKYDDRAYVSVAERLYKISRKKNAGWLYWEAEAINPYNMLEVWWKVITDLSSGTENPVADEVYREVHDPFMPFTRKEYNYHEVLKRETVESVAALKNKSLG